MFPYWSLFAIFAVGALTNRTGAAGRVHNWGMLVFAVVAMALMVGLRFEVGPDWEPYLSIFKRWARSDLATAIVHEDPGFYSMVWAVHRLKLGIWALNSFSAAVLAIGLIAFAKRQPNPWLAVAVAVPYLVIAVAMSATRQSIAIGFILLALAAFARQAPYRFIFWTSCASLFHASAFLMLLVASLSYTRNRTQSILLLCVVSVPAYFLLSGSFETYIERYSNVDIQSEGTIYRVLMNFFPAIFLLSNLTKFVPETYQKSLWRNLAVISVVCLPILLVVPSSSALDRISLYVIPLQILVLARLPQVVAKDPNDIPLHTLAVLAYLALVMFVFFHFSNHAVYYVPYRLFPIF